MRIAYLTQSYPPMISGAALTVEKLASAMAKRGHQVLVIGASDREKPYHTYQENLTIIRLSSIHNPLRAKQRFLLFPGLAIQQALHKFQPDIIHAHEPLQTAWAGIMYAHLHRIPIALTVHQVPSFAASYLPNLPRLGRQLEALLWTYARGLIKNFTAVITPSLYTSKLLTDVTRVKATTISNGIDLRQFHPALAKAVEIAIRTKLRLPFGVPIILHVGRLDTDKKVDRVIKAAALALQNTDAHLLIVGDGYEKNTLENLCQSLGIADRTHFTSLISDQRYLADIYRMACLFVTASEIETQGIVLLEAVASGLPIVAVNTTCIPEIVHDQVNGILAQPGDIRSLGDAILNMVTHSEQTTRMGRAGLKLVQKHNLQNTMDIHEKLYLNSILQVRAEHYLHNQLLRLKGWMDLFSK